MRGVETVKMEESSVGRPTLTVSERRQKADVFVG
jgi:hypothetical protein